jgi:hypothetical protein
MESSLVIEPKTASIDKGIFFVGLTPAEKVPNSNWESPEMNSYWR